MLVKSYNEDPAAKQLLTELSLSASNDRGYSLDKGMILYKGHIWVGHNLRAHHHIL